MKILFGLVPLLIGLTASANVPHYSWLPKLFKGPNFTINSTEVVEMAEESRSSYELFEKLIKKYPGLQTTFTLIYRSQSIQRADELNPRIVFFTPNGLFFSFESMTPAGRVEIIEFNDKKLKFDFKEVKFKQGKAEVDHQPKTCVACHAGQPVWERYADWPGVYGSRDDYFFKERQTPESLEERARLKTVIQTHKNPYLKTLGLGMEDYYVNEYPGREEIFSPLRRNSYLLFHLGYYNFLTQLNGIGSGYSYNMSLLRGESYFLGGSMVSEYAARTHLYGLEPNEIYKKVGYNGNGAGEIGIPEHKKNTYRDLARELNGRREKSELAPLARCVSCHGEQRERKQNPFIPFNDVAGLTELLKTTDLKEKVSFRISRESVGTRLQMPPQTALSEGERAAILSLVEELSER